MKAAQYNSYGDSNVIEINPNAPTPTPKEGQLLVEVHAASANPFDYKLRRGYMKESIPLQFPVTIGGDFSGVVIDFGNSNEYKKGDEVYGQALILTGASGSMAEFTAANTKNLSLKPQNISHDEASSLVLVGISAIQALEEHAHLQSGQRVLIHGGAGGIGSLAIQLAKHIGAYVITTVGTDDIEFVKSLGADEVIDYKKEQFQTMVKDVDVVYDAVGKTIEESATVLKDGGVLVSMADVDGIKREGITAIAQNSGVTTARLQRLKELVESGVIKPQIAKTFSLDQAAEAYDFLENSHPKGKVVVHIK